MKKPLIVAKEDFTRQLQALIQNCDLPVIILEPIIKKLYDEISYVYEKAYKEEREQYESNANEQLAERN